MRLQSVDLFAHLKKRRTYPGIFPLLHLDHIYYEGARVEVRKVELPRTRRALRRRITCRSSPTCESGFDR
jgi:hypothetical protein